ncbi:MAG TPA: sigma-70 family RNA polymerase sigma factor [Kofleriaceae bacterium]|nr:sigma-70 family RNA polymerase sigma factor [Kofleriaceae bacterium]
MAKVPATGEDDQIDDQIDDKIDDEIDAARSAGDRHRVLTLLMARYGSGVYRFAMAMTRERNLAEEVRQQVFVDACRDLDRVAASSSLPHWLFGIARYRCLDPIYARARWNQRYKNDPPREPEPAGSEPDLDRDRLTRALRACLDKLAPAARQAVMLRYQQGLSYDQAAAIVGDPPGTLRKRVARALPVLRRHLEAELKQRAC